MPFLWRQTATAGIGTGVITRVLGFKMGVARTAELAELYASCRTTLRWDDLTLPRTADLLLIKVYPGATYLVGDGGAGGGVSDGYVSSVTPGTPGGPNNQVPNSVAGWAWLSTNRELLNTWSINLREGFRYRPRRSNQVSFSLGTGDMVELWATCETTARLTATMALAM